MRISGEGRGGRGRAQVGGGERVRGEKEPQHHTDVPGCTVWSWSPGVGARCKLVGISTSAPPGPSRYAVLECTCDLVCISPCMHFTLCSHTLLSQVASTVTTTMPRPRHNLKDVSRRVMHRIIGRVGIIGRMTVPILTCFFFQDVNVSSLDYLAPVRAII